MLSRADELRVNDVEVLHVVLGRWAKILVENENKRMNSERYEQGNLITHYYSLQGLFKILSFCHSCPKIAEFTYRDMKFPSLVCALIAEGYDHERQKSSKNSSSDLDYANYMDLSSLMWSDVPFDNGNSKESMVI